MELVNRSAACSIKQSDHELSLNEPCRGGARTAEEMHRSVSAKKVDQCANVAGCDGHPNRNACARLVRYAAPTMFELGSGHCYAYDYLPHSQVSNTDLAGGVSAVATGRQ